MWFVKESTYDKEVARRKKAEDDLLDMELKWYEARLETNKARTECISYRELLNQMRFENKSESTFTSQEIKTLIVLCHPDKHRGNKNANDITIKLLGMR